MATTGELRVRAYYIWEAKGWPGDSALSDWLEAESAAAEAAALAEEMGMAEPADAPPAAKPAPRKRAAEPTAASVAVAPSPVTEAKKSVPRARKKATSAAV